MNGLGDLFAMKAPPGMSQEEVGAVHLAVVFLHLFGEHDGPVGELCHIRGTWLRFGDRLTPVGPRHAAVQGFGDEDFPRYSHCRRDPSRCSARRC